MSTILIGIAGGTGFGKTTLTRHLKEHFGPEVSVISHDSYYKRQDGKTLEERAKVNYDHPAAFDTDLLIEHLKELKAGRPIQCPVYSYVEHNRTAETREILPTKVIIVEGILIFENRSLCDLMDIRVFVDTDADIRIIRSIQTLVWKIRHFNCSMPVFVNPYAVLNGGLDNYCYDDACCHTGCRP